MLKRAIRMAAVGVALALAQAPMLAQDAEGLRVPPVPEGPMLYDTAEGFDIEVKVLARGLDHPFSIVFLPDGSALVTERVGGRIRRIVDGELLEKPLSGVPRVLPGQYSGLLDIALHPDFDNQPYIYFSYNKPLPNNQTAVTYARGRWNGQDLENVEDVFQAANG